MSAHLVRSRPVDELLDARRMAHRMILTKPDAPGRLLLSVYCLELGEELRRRGTDGHDCPICRHDVDAVADASLQLVEATA